MTVLTARERIEQERAAREAADIAAYSAFVVAQTSSKGRVNVHSYGAIGDGVTADDEAINAALAAGLVVEFGQNKTYLITSDLLVRSNQIIIGNNSRLITDRALYFMMRNAGSDQAGYTGGSNILIMGLVFDNESVLRDCGFIGLTHTSNVTIRDCVFKNLNGSVYHAIDAPGNEFLTIENCYFINCQGATTLQIDAATSGSITFYTSPQMLVDGTRSKNITIKGNKFFSCGTYNQVVHLHKKGHSYISILDNHFRDCYRAISDDLGSTYRANGATTDIIIRGNIIDSTLAGGGIFLDFVKRVVIADNIIQGPGGGIQVLNYYAPVTITGITKASVAVVTTLAAHGFSNGNIIYISGVVGMTNVNGNWYKTANVTATTFELTTVDASANVNSAGYGTYTSGGGAIYREFSGTYRNTDILIANNQIKSTNSDAITVENCNRAKVIDNTVTEYGEDNLYKCGIGFDLVFPLTCSGNTIESTTSGTKNAIRLARCYQYSITNNKMDRGAFGVIIKRLNQSENDCGRIANNHFDLGTTYMIYLLGSSAYPVKGVTITGNHFDGTYSGHCVRCEYGSMLSICGNTFATVKASSGALSLNNVSNSTISGNAIEAATSSTATAIAVYGSGSSGRTAVTGNFIKGFATAVDMLTSSANYGAVVGNTFSGITSTVTSLGAGVVSANNCTF